MTNYSLFGHFKDIIIESKSVFYGHFKTFPCINICQLLTFQSNTRSFADKSILTNTLRITTSISKFTFSPIVSLTFRTLCSSKPKFSKYLSWIILIRVSLEFRANKFLNFLNIFTITLAVKPMVTSST